MTKPLTPLIPAPPRDEPAVPPLRIGPRAALAAAAAVAVLAAALAVTLRPTRPPVTEQVAIAPVATASYSVQMANYAFAPASITVNEGDTITWTNQDTAPHTVTTTSGPERLNSPYLSKGQSWSYTFTAPGTYMYYCTVHPDMRAEVIVRAPAPPSTAAAVHRAQTSAPGAQAAAPTHADAGTSSTVATPPPAHTASSAAAAAPVASPSASGPAHFDTPPQSQSQQTADAGSGISSLSPVLLLGGLTAAIAVFCLLLVASRPATESKEADQS